MGDDFDIVLGLSAPARVPRVAAAGLSLIGTMKMGVS